MPPPGPTFLARHVHWIATPPLLAFIGAYAIERASGVALSWWQHVAACILLYPVSFYAHQTFHDLRTRRLASAMGAAMPPYVTKKGVKVSGEDKFQRMFF